MAKTWCCPFWQWKKPLEVHCEGGCLVFPDAEARRLYIGRHCATINGWEDCTIAKNLMEYYERAERNEAKYQQN